MNNPSLKPSVRCRACFLLLAASLASCSATLRPIYNSDEQAKAEKAAAQLHQFYNEGRSEEIYALLDDEFRSSMTKDAFVTAARQAAEKWGKVQSASLSEAKVFPSSPIQVRMIYNVKFEKGDGQEWLIWNVHGKDVRLLQYQIKPGFDKRDDAK